VSRFDSPLDPLRELLLEYGSTDICDPLLGRLRQLELGFRQVVVNFGMVIIQEISDVLHTEAIVPKF